MTKRQDSIYATGFNIASMCRKVCFMTFVFLFWVALGVVIAPETGCAQELPEAAISESSENTNSAMAGLNEEVITETVLLSFAEPSDVISILQSYVTESSRVSADEGSNAVVLSGAPDQIEFMKKRIKEVDVQRFTMVFELGVAKASELSEKVEGMLTKNVGRVKFDDESNKLIITDTSAKIEEVRKIVEQLDRRDRQIHIDTKIVEISLNDEHRTGVDWEAIVSDYRQLKFNGQENDQTDANAVGQLSVGTIANEDYQILIEALDTVGSVEMISNPGITAAQNKEARILVGSTQPLVPNVASAAGAGESVDSVDIGAKLFVTPTIQASGAITLKIRPEINTMAMNSQTADSASDSVIEKSGSETTVMIKEGATIVIGGLIKEEKSKLTKKVPILGDVPFLGMAFRSYSHSVRKTEVVIFLKPKLSTGETL